jgi:16S rRNA (cytosine967-C5)-methyltransferase
MPVSPARAAAFAVLMRVEQTDAYASELLHSEKFAKLSAADHGLATELVMGVLRWRGVLDEQTARYVQQPLPKLDLEVLTAVRLGAYQVLFLNRVPAHAAINESVELVKQAKKKSAAGLVNAVLRKIASQHPSPGGTGEELSLPRGTSHPRWIIERWEQLYGEEVTRKICDYDQSAPKSVVRISPETPEARVNGALHSGLISHIENAGNDRGPAPVGQPRATAATAIGGVHLEPGKLLSHAAIVAAGDVSQSAAFRNHELVIQDEGSQLVALLMGTGKTILDCCAAPGGKTRILAQENPDATVVAIELHPRRAALLKRLVSEPNIRVVAADARAIPFSGQFDRILVDAPCSGTGTLARNPEIKWRLKPEDLIRLQTYQLEILSATMRQSAPAGQVIYSTCSLEPEENQQVIEKALAANSGFRAVDARERLNELSESGELAWKDIDSLLDGPYLRTIPGVHPCDGFFAAVLEQL